MVCRFFFPNNTLFGFLWTLYGAFSHVNHNTTDVLRRSGKDFLSGQFEGFAFAQGVFHPLNTFAYRAFTHPVIGPDRFHGTVFSVVFEGYRQFVRY
jgi:hypothetical protein